MKATLLIDMDNTLNFFGEAFVQEVINEGFDYDISCLDFYDIESGIQVDSKKEKSKIKNMIFSKLDFWENIPPIEYAVEAIKYLETKFEVIIATTPWRFEEKYTDAKRNWMEHHFPFFDSDKIIFSEKKYDLLAEGIIDDKIEVLENCSKAGMYTIAFHQPYNASTKTDFRLFSWEMEEVGCLVNHMYKTIKEGK
jgi:5'(3')-deoxyribonucleotidase